MAQLDDKTLQNLNKRLKEMDEILASDYRKALDLGKAFTQGFSTEQIDAFLRKLGKINRADAAKLNVMFNLVDVNGRPITVQEAKYRIEQLKGAIERGQASTKIRGTSIVGLGTMTNELKRYKDALSVLGMSTSQQFDLISRNVKKVNNEVKGLRKGFGDMLPTIRRLASAFGVAFSVRGLAQFGKKLIETRGEFERQQVALRSILQNKQLADEIWDKTMQAALQSPFTAMQLTTYTKQLAAYRIETDKLFDTTKRLADVSAGLGVDMQRLILAYGQVKAANYLRASEIRQFTEAGVNVLGELRDYFNDVKGMSVDTAQVMEMVTKRLVTFEDVEAIFKRMTDAGGIFYDMQYVQSQTVKGQIAKLHDAYDQMLNNIGKANEGVLKDMVALLNNIVKNWREWKTALDLIVWPLLISSVYKFSRGLLSTAASAVVAKGSFNSLTTAGAKLQLTLKGLLSSLKSNPWIAIATAVATATIALINHNKQIKAIQNEINEQNTRLYETELLLNGYQKKIEENNKVIKESQKGTKELTESQKDNKNILAKLKEEYPELAKGLKLEYDGTIVLTDVIKNYNDELDRQITLKNILAQQSKSGGFFGLFSDTYTENLTQYTTALSQMRGEILSAQHTAKAIQMQMREAGDENLPFFNALQEIIDIDMTDIEEAAKKYNKIKGLLFSYEVEGESEAGGVKRVEKIAGAEKYSSQLPALTEWAKTSAFAVDAIKDNLAVFEDLLSQSLYNVEEYSNAIIEQYSGDVSAFLRDNVELINKGVTEGNADVVSSIRYVLQTQGGATSAEAKQWYNKILNDLLLFSEKYQRIEELNRLVADESLKSGKKQNRDAIAEWKAEIAAIKEEIANAPIIDFFANKPSVTNGNQTPFPDGGNGKTRENASKLISLIKEMRSEYDKLSKSAYGYAKSEEKVREAYKDSVKEILGKAGITDYDFTTNEGMIKALEKVKSYATKLGKDAAAEVQKYIDQLETEIEINAQVRIREDFGKQMEKAFNDYELTIELKKLNISPEAAKGLFPEFDAQTLGDLQNEMQAFYMQQGATFDEEDLKEYQKWAEKLDSEILKDRKEKAKDYSKYLEKEYSERAKLEMKYAQDVAFVTANFNGEQRQNILSGIEDKYKKDISELTWKSFKESAFYVEMMDDLSSIPVDYMQIMLGKIEELLQNPETLSPRALKEAINARQKILESLMDYDQVKVMSQSLSEIHTAMNDSEVGGSTWRQTKKRLDEQQKLKAEELANLEKEIRANETLQGQLKGLEDAQQAFNDASANLSKQTQEDLKGKDSASLMAEYNVELENARKSVKAFSEIEGEATSEQRDANAKLVARIEYLEIAIPLLEAYKKASEGLWSYENTDEGKAATSAQDKGQTSSSIGTIITGQKSKADNLSNRLSLLKKWQKSFVNLNNAWAKFNKNAADMASRLGALASASFELYEALGGETNAMTEAWKEFGSTITNVITESLTMIPQLVAGFTAAGVTINAAMGIIGLIAEAIQLVLVLITGLAKLHDARYEKEIEIQQKKIDELQRAYERLEKQIEKTWDTISYMKVYNDETQNLYEQIQALNAQMNAEESKKNVDKDKIQDYKDKIQDAEDELEELAQKQIEVFGGIGEEGYRDAAQGFVDAWKSAFFETGDGLQGLQDHFDEFLNEWFVKQATMRVAGKMLEPLFRDIDNAVDKYSGGGTSVMMSELAKIRERFGIIAPQLSDTLDELSGLWGIGGEGGLSGLAAGIQGMTEEQANVLEAYWNSVRGYTANIDMNVSRIAQILGAGGDNTNPMLAQMTLVAQNTNNIRTLLESVRFNGGEGAGIRVYSF